ncbi:MAG: excinuclease ABC subunit UvrC [Pseudomonadota bacterium]|nr:excinuclease ABC subunit UvrC [Pseudomonadota bacterium]
MVQENAGVTYLKEQLKQAPSSPGVYRMLNEKGDVLYVGKAKNLKNRLTNYTQFETLTQRIKRMVFETRELILVETETESEALLLEINLIKSLKPKYNILFRDDTSYLSIRITGDETPRLMPYRGKKDVSGELYGPYPSGDAVYRTIDLMERVFRLRTCADSVFKNRTRPCLKYDIKRCSAPCVGKVSTKEYDDLITQARAFLKGNGAQVQKALSEGMQKASADMRYEVAAEYRDRLKALQQVLTPQHATTNALVDADVVGMYMQGGEAAVQVFYYRAGQHVGNHVFYPKGVEAEEASEVMRVFLALHYGTRRPPKEIFVSDMPGDMDSLLSYLKERNEGRAVSVQSPSRGDKHQMVKKASLNAEQAFKRKGAAGAGWKKQMAAFAEVLGVPEVSRVETFDISNISGTNPVASLVVAGEEGMLKSEYRKFSITVKNTPDDYAMMREALTRRYGRMARETEKARKEKTEPPVWPTVVMVDGGKGHLRVLVEVFDELGLLYNGKVVLCAIAKGEERDKGLEVIWRYGLKEALPIEKDTPLIFLLQQIRDEAHRFAINFHRQKRSKEMVTSKLDQIPGIGAKRKKALLLAFGSASGVEGASVSQLMQVEGISKSIAEHIYGFFHG